MSNMLFDIPQPEKAPANPTPEIADKPYKHSVVDSAKTPIETIASYIGGSNFLCVYYQQQLTKSEELKAFDPLQLNVYQQYHKINDFIIKLQGPLSGSDDSGSTGRFTLTGTAIIPPLPNLIPNWGDALIADIGEGRAGQFTVTNVRKMSHNLAAAWEIEFGLDRIADQKMVSLLDSKVSKETWYQKDYLITGQNPLLTTEDFRASKSLNDWFKIIGRQLVDNNFSLQTRGITVPLQSVITYDPFVPRAIMRMLTEDDVPQLRNVTLFNCDDYRIVDRPDIYTAVINRDPTLLYSVFRDFRASMTSMMTSLAFQHPIRLSGIRRIVVPYTDRLDNDNSTTLNDFIARTSNPLMPGIQANSETLAGLDGCGCSNQYNPYYKEKQAAIDAENVNMPGMQIPTITNDSYVLTKAFFDKNLIDCSQFERDIWDILDNKPANREHIYAYCESYQRWGRLEQFYLGPLLLMLIKYAIKGI